MHFALEDYEELEKDSAVRPIHAEWEVPAGNRGKLEVEGNRISRRQLSLFDDNHRQITSRLPLPQAGVHSLRFKVVSYGQQQPYDAIYFGLTTESRKSLPNSDGREKDAVAYCSAPNSFGVPGEGVGSLLVEGRQLAYADLLFVREGAELKLRLDADSGEVVWDNGRQEVVHRWSKWAKGKEVFLFVSMSSHLATVSWKGQ
jgi:hypothetical protein